MENNGYILPGTIKRIVSKLISFLLSSRSVATYETSSFTAGL